MNIFFCGDIVRVCEVMNGYYHGICVDVDIPGAAYVPGVEAEYHSSEHRHLCEYDNSEINIKGVQVILIDKFTLNTVGGVLAACGMKPENESFWHDAARYTPSHFENFKEYPPGIEPVNVERIRAFDLDMNIYRGVVSAQNTSDLMPIFAAAQEKLRYILGTNHDVVRSLAEERIQQMEREWRGLTSIGEKSFRKKSARLNT